ncbi:MAG: glycosyltransferase family 4 protein [Balneola sp.]
MRIAVVSHLFPTKRNPFQGKFIKDQLELLASTEEIESVKLFTPTPFSIPFTNRFKNNSSDLLAKNSIKQRINYISFPQKRFPSLIQKSLSKRLLTALNCDFDLFHFHFAYPSGLAIPSFAKKGFKTVLTIHGGDYYRTVQNKNLVPYVNDIISSADRILSVGPELLHDLQKKYPSENHKIYEIGNLVDENAYTLPSKNQKAEARKKLGWEKGLIHFLCIGNNRPEKGIDLLFKSSKNLLGLADKIKIHIVGNIEDEFSIKELVPNVLVDIIPPQKPSELIDYYHAADVYIMPSRKEGFGLSLIEAACTGLPSIASETGIARNFVTKETGFLIPNINPEILEKSIRKMSQNCHNFNSESIRETVVKSFGIESFQKNLIWNYKNTLG